MCHMGKKPKENTLSLIKIRPFSYCLANAFPILLSALPFLLPAVAYYFAKPSLIFDCEHRVPCALRPL